MYHKLDPRDISAALVSRFAWSGQACNASSTHSGQIYHIGRKGSGLRSRIGLPRGLARQTSLQWGCGTWSALLPLAMEHPSALPCLVIAASRLPWTLISSWRVLASRAQTHLGGVLTLFASLAPRSLQMVAVIKQRCAS
jgi:hypothetical protein